MIKFIKSLFTSKKQKHFLNADEALLRSRQNYPDYLKLVKDEILKESKQELDLIFEYYIESAIAKGRVVQSIDLKPFRIETIYALRDKGYNVDLMNNTISWSYIVIVEKENE